MQVTGNTKINHSVSLREHAEKEAFASSLEHRFRRGRMRKIHTGSQNLDLPALASYNAIAFIWLTQHISGCLIILAGLSSPLLKHPAR